MKNYEIIDLGEKNWIILSSEKDFSLQQKGIISLQEGTQAIKKGRWRWNHLTQKLFLKSLI